MNAPPPFAALDGILKGIEGEPLVILLSGCPDPDAIGSAVAHVRLCALRGVPAEIAHFHPVSLRQNRALVKQLDLDLVQITSGDDLARFKHLSLVDTSLPEAGVRIPEHLHLLSVVDHHPILRRPEAAFTDIRPNFGTSCTIYTQYLRQAEVLAEGIEDDVRVATALFFGIQTDTDDFLSATAADFEAAAWLRPQCDIELLKRVGRRNFSAVTMSVIGRALASLVVVRDFAIAGVGLVDAGFRDAIPMAADFIVQREDIDTVLVFGIVGGAIEGSLRTDSPSVDPSLFLRNAFGDDPSGRPHGGGRAEKGAFLIPLGFLGEGESPSDLWPVVEDRVRRRVARVVPGLAP